MYAQGLIRPCKRDIKDVMDSTRTYFSTIRNRSMDELDFCKYLLAGMRAFGLRSQHLPV